MNRLIAIAIALAAVQSSVSVAASEAPSAGLQVLLDDFALHASKDQTKDVSDAVMASPALARQLGDLVAANQFKGFAIVSEESLQGSPFAATIDHGKIVFTARFLEQPAQQRIFDIVHPGDILPNNLVFALGALAFHLQAAATPKTMPADKETFMHLAMEEDASSFLQGWNDVVDAAIHENHDQPLVVSQQGALWLNLRYRSVIPGTDNSLDQSPSGALPLTDKNVAKVGEFISHVNMLDFGAMSGFAAPSQVH